MRSVVVLFLSALTLLSTEAFPKDKTYRPARLPDGRPDLQGTWANSNSTPLERPAGFDTLIISPAQAAQVEAILERFLEDRSTPTEPTEYNAARQIEPIRGALHSSIIVDPEDGHLPGTPLFKAWADKVRSNIVNVADGPEQRPTSERCLGNPASQPPHLSALAVNLHQIVQTERVVIFVSEVMHDARIIRMNAKHAPAAITSWLGDSIGWWDGDTLVVETKYFTSSDTGRTSPFVSFLVSPRTTVTERFTRVAADKLEYVFAVDDPTYYTRPWTGEGLLRRTDEQMFEYACQEGNDSLKYILQSARVREVKIPSKQ